MPTLKTPLLKLDFCVCSRKLVRYILRTYSSNRQSMLILKADVCIFDFVYDEAKV